MAWLPPKDASEVGEHGKTALRGSYYASEHLDIRLSVHSKVTDLPNECDVVRAHFSRLVCDLMTADQHVSSSVLATFTCSRLAHNE